MKIAFIVDKFPALSEMFILNQITGLIDLGYQVEIFSMTKPGEQRTQPDVEKYKLLEHVHYFPMVPSNKAIARLKALYLIATNFLVSPSLMPRILKRLLSRSEGFSYRLLFFSSLFKRKKFDIIHAHFGPNGKLVADMASVGIHVKFLTTFHGYDINMYPKMYGSDIYNTLFQTGELFTANTAFTKQQMTKLDCDERKIEILPVGLDTGKFEFHPRSAPDDKPIIILTIGRLVEKKGYEYSIKAFAKVAVKHRNIVYKIVGGGPLENELKSLVSELKLQKQVQFLGPLTQDEILKLYKQAHLFVLASVTADNGDMEGQGLVLQEAQATGLPVISTLHNGIPDGVLDGQSGFLVPEKDVNALAEKLEYLIENPQLWTQMGKCGNQFVEKKYDIKILNQKLVSIYQKLL